MKYKIIITGGAGFIGSTLALFLKRDFPSSEIITFDNLKRRGSELNLPRLKKAGITFIHGDIRNPEDLEQLSVFDLLLECSAEPSVLAAFSGDAAYMIHTNLVGTSNCLEIARKFKADILFLSTSRVYPFRAIQSLCFDERDSRLELNERQSVKGVSQKGISEEFPLEGVRSLYGATKLASELLITEYSDMYGLKSVINRCGVVSGPWQMGKVDQGFAVLWIARHLFAGKLSYIGFGGKGKQVRDILHVNDLYSLICKQLQDLHRINGQIFNVGGGSKNSVSLLEFTQIVKEITGKTISINSVAETRPADVPYYVSDCSKVERTMNWHPTYTVHQVVEEITHWIENNQLQLKSVLE